MTMGPGWLALGTALLLWLGVTLAKKTMEETTMPRPTKPTIYYDPECEKLAEHFLRDDRLAHTEGHAARIHALAADIQQAVEAWCDANAEQDSMETFDKV
jgi:hypothetical protein